jgi:hypothetical protein
MPLAELKTAAETLYGPEWQSPLAGDLGVALRTVQRWAAGDMQPPDVRAELAAICCGRIQQLSALAKHLETT